MNNGTITLNNNAQFKIVGTLTQTNGRGTPSVAAIDANVRRAAPGAREVRTAAASGPTDHELRGTFRRSGMVAAAGRT
jgi:hypothetical protein